MARPIHAFFSYSRANDEDADGAIGALRDELQRRARVTGQAHDPRGEHLAERLQTELHDALFYVPVLTPGSFDSPWCRMGAVAGAEVVFSRHASGWSLA